MSINQKWVYQLGHSIRAYQSSQSIAVGQLLFLLVELLGDGHRLAGELVGPSINQLNFLIAILRQSINILIDIPDQSINFLIDILRQSIAINRIAAGSTCTSAVAVPAP